MYLSQFSYKNSKDAIQHATIYLDAYEKMGDVSANRATINFMKNNKDKLIENTTMKSFEEFIK